MILTLKNCSTDAVELLSSAWELIDSDGYAYRAKAFCDYLYYPRMAELNSKDIQPSTRVRFALLFPELDEGIKISQLIYADDGGRKIRIQLCPLKENVQNEFSLQAAETKKEKVSAELQKDWDFQNTLHRLSQLEMDIFSRFNNTLSQKDISYIDNRIMNTEFFINQKIDGYDKNRQSIIVPKFQSLMGDYHEKIVSQKLDEQTSIEIDEKITNLYDLSPREFEEWAASLFSALGYEKVTLTPQSSDKGIDVLAEKDGFKVAMQCKKFKGVVGSPIVQAFLGAMQTAEIKRGFLVTTGTFSVEAEKLAVDMPIELWDCVKLRLMLKEILKK